ncbi:MAG: alpha/beta hydrolase [Leptospiraceae bacterium]|nr:alpha/beta hydrolase [Leptospiraceae bacterium]
MSVSEWKNSGKYMDYLGNQIFFKDEGKGEVILLVHGFPTASYDYNLIWKELISKYRVITYDMIGFGFSDKPKSFEYSIMKQADLLESVLKNLGVQKVKILTHDYGVSVIQEILARFLERKDYFQIENICFLNGGLFPETHKPRSIQKLLLSPIGFIISKLMNKKKFSKSFSEVFGKNSKPSQEELDEFWELINYKDGKNLSHKHIQYMKERKKFRERWVGALQKSTIPICIIYGPADPISGIHMTERYEELIPNPNIKLLNDSIGHYPQVEDPKAVLENYLSFIR